MISKKQKKDIVKQLEEAIDASQSVVLTNFNQVDVESIREFRSKLRENDCQYKVAKKTLVDLALKNKKIEGIDLTNAQGTVGVGYSETDEVAVIKTVSDFGKDNETFQYFAGIVDGKVVTMEELKSLASLPGKDVLRGQVVGTIAAPISGFVNVLAGNVRGLVNVLNGIKDSKESA